MAKFREVKTLQKFASVHASIHNHFNHQRYLNRRDIFKQDRSAALAKWRQLAACPSSKQMGLLSVFHKGGSGSSLFDVKPLGVDGSSGGFGWSVF